ncbi:hypothetical protein, partial [Salmonella enterica]|uniref:hypothetical protein n=1 Tax=Salmonella enterica TaxID=28901 RepID=UPI001C62EFA0
TEILMVLLAYFEFYIKIVFLYKAGLFFVFFSWLIIIFIYKNIFFIKFKNGEWPVEEEVNPIITVTFGLSGYECNWRGGCICR